VYSQVFSRHPVQVNVIFRCSHTAVLAVKESLLSIVCSVLSVQPYTNQQTHAAELMIQSHKVSYTCEVADHERVGTCCPDGGIFMLIRMRVVATSLHFFFYNL
jgi:hypothetical protein